MDIIIDKKSHRKILRQSEKIEQGVRVNQSLTFQVRDLVLPVLEDYNIRCFNYYGDMFSSSQLIRFKFEISKMDDTVLQGILDSVVKVFKIREISYVDKDKHMVIIWM